jgi:arabinose-5-phosphate isomerase
VSIERAKKVLDIEACAIRALKKKVGKEFSNAIDAVCRSRGRVIVTGMGKPGFIAQKMSATLSSTGTPSLYLHPAEALHGDLGRITRDDVLIAFSNSGETDEIVRLLPILKKIGVRLIAIVGKARSTLAKNSNYVLDVSVAREACSLNLAPTASTTAMLAMADAFAVALLDKKGFKEKDFAFYHPGGILGKRLLLTVEDIMRKKTDHPVVKETLAVKEVLLRITKARAGSATVVNAKGQLVGIFTDGDLRRHIEKDKNLLVRKVKNVMTKDPLVIREHHLAAEAFQILRARKIDELPVVNKQRQPVGLIDVQDILKAGIV